MGHAIELTSEEQALLSTIDLRGSHRNHDEGRAAYLANQKPILALLRSLIDRKAIPEARQKYWNDPAYQTGRMKGSWRDIFRRNGNEGADIYTHPHFVPFLRYFLFGAELPVAVIEAFEEKVGDPRWVSSSDVIPLGAYARKLIRDHRLDVSTAPEEFFKLCLDLGLSLNVAGSVLSSAKRVRYSGK